MSNVVFLQFIICLTVQVALAQQASRQPTLDRAIINLLNEDNARNSQEPDSSLERVDKLASATGDLYWHMQPQQHQQQLAPDWFYQQSAPSFRYQRSLAEPINGESTSNFEANYQKLVSPSVSDGYLSAAAPQSAALIGLDGPTSSRNYHALVDEFKQYSRMANPSRESRAFKPKLMSTARGFGKRSQQSFKSNSDLFGGPNTGGKLTGSELR